MLHEHLDLVHGVGGVADEFVQVDVLDVLDVSAEHVLESLLREGVVEVFLVVDRHCWCLVKVGCGCCFALSLSLLSAINDI